MENEKKVKKRRGGRAIKSIFWIAVLAVAAWVFLFGNDVVSFSGIKNFFREIFTSAEKTETAALNGAYVEDVKPFRSGVLTLSDVGVTVLNKNGKEMLSAQHGCASPAAVCCGDRFLVFDRGGTRWELFGAGGSVRGGVAPYKIIDAAVSSGGSIALVTASKSYHNEVHYYDDDGAEKYIWYSADNYIYKVGMRENGKAFVLLGVNSSGGESESYAFFFDPRSEKEPVRAELGCNIFYYVSYKGNDVTLIGEAETLALDAAGATKSAFAYDGMQLLGYANTKSMTYLVFSRYGVGRALKLVALKPSGEQAAEAELSADFRCITAGESGVTVLGSHEVYVYSSKLRQKHIAETISDGSYACSVGGSVFVFGAGSIIRTEY